MAPPDHLGNGVSENGDAEKEFARQTDADNHATADAGEYGNLVRFISNYKDGRRASIAASSIGDAEPKKKWYQFGKKKGGSPDSFDTPEEWLNTDWKQGLKTTDVESRRRKTGWNELSTEEVNLFKQFLGYFQGPILYGTLNPIHMTRNLTFGLN
jgi:H+-transporting ATPase